MVLVEARGTAPRSREPTCRRHRRTIIGVVRWSMVQSLAGYFSFVCRPYSRADEVIMKRRDFIREGRRRGLFPAAAVRFARKRTSSCLVSRARARLAREPYGCLYAGRDGSIRRPAKGREAWPQEASRYVTGYACRSVFLAGGCPRTRRPKKTDVRGLRAHVRHKAADATPYLGRTSTGRAGGTSRPSAFAVLRLITTW